jgi:hypothetical protein
MVYMRRSVEEIYILSTEATSCVTADVENLQVSSLEDELKLQLILEAYKKYSLTELERKLK